MQEIIEWFKESIGYCTRLQYMNEDELKGCMLKLEERYNLFEKEEKTNLKNLLENNLEPRDLVWVLSVFTAYMSCEDFKIMLSEVACKTNYDEYLYSVSLEFQVKMRLSGNYEKKRYLRKKSIDIIKDKIQCPEFIPKEQRDKGTAVIITTQILSMLHAPTNIILSFAYVMQKYLGYNVYIFACTEDERMPEHLFYNSYCFNANPNINFGINTFTYQGQVINICQLKTSDKDFIQEYQEVLSFISGIKPHFALAMGCFSCFGDIINEIVDVAAINMTLECPISEANIIMRKDDKNVENEYDSYLQKTGQKYCFIEEKYPLIVEKSEVVYSRKDEGLPENKLLIAIAGNRLEMEIDEEFIQLCACIVKRCKNVAFGFLGECENILKLFSNPVFEGYVFDLGFRKDLYATYKMFDLYLNPKRRGGGWSSIIALSAGVPVITLKYGDVYYSVGDKYAYESYEHILDEVIKCSEDRDYLNKKKEISKEYPDNSEKNLVEYVSNVLKQIIDEIEE